MKKMNFCALALTFAGCFLGAGYISGQELYQFFSSFGEIGYIGLFMAIVLQSLFGVILISLATKTGVREMDKILIMSENKILRNAFALLQEVFLFGIFVIMAAGAASLGAEVFSLPQWAGSLIFCAFTLLISAKGIGAMIKVFSFFVPCLVAVTAAVSFFVLHKNGFPEIVSSGKEENPLLKNWFLSSLSFVSYNIFGSIGIITPLADRVKRKKTLIGGIFLGGALLLLIALGILLSVAVYPGSEKTDLPMLAVAQDISPFLGYVYAFLLFGGMFGTSVSSVVALKTYAEIKIPVLNEKRIVMPSAICLLGFGLSLVGFSDLIGVIYPVFGYLGFAALLIILLNMQKIRSYQLQ